MKRFPQFAPYSLTGAMVEYNVDFEKEVNVVQVATPTDIIMLVYPLFISMGQLTEEVYKCSHRDSLLSSLIYAEAFSTVMPLVIINWCGKNEDRLKMSKDGESVANLWRKLTDHEERQSLAIFLGELFSETEFSVVELACKGVLPTMTVVYDVSNAVH